jgi:hypothetical protein
MIVLVTLVLPVGADSGPFNLFSNTDGFTTAFDTNISASSLVAGYTSTSVPTGTTTIRVVSTGTCTNYIDIQVSLITTTTTSSSTSTTTSTSTSTSTSTTTTSTSTSSSTTTTTTTIPPSTTTTTSTIPPTTTTTTTLRTTTYCYVSIWSCPDPIHHPEVNSWVDYIDNHGNLIHFIVGCSSCTCIQASSIVSTNGVRTCTPS